MVKRKWHQLSWIFSDCDEVQTTDLCPFTYQNAVLTMATESETIASFK